MKKDPTYWGPDMRHPGGREDCGVTEIQDGGQGTSPKYVIISPIRDEEENVERLIQSVVSQTIRPAEWIIVDDGSRDRTGKILDEYAAREPWIYVVHRQDRGFRKSGGGVMEAFSDGYSALKTFDWEFLVKLDGDLSFADDYFALCFERFKQNPRLGVGGGTIMYQGLHGLMPETCQSFHVRGATKIYRRNCWEAIGELMRGPGWDTLDEIKANMLGWQTLSFADVPIIQHRETGGADGIWKNAVKNGRANYACGYHPLFMVVKCAIRFFHPPYVVSALGLFTGFLSGYVQHLPRIEDKRIVRYLRTQQMNRLTFSDSLWK
jgi:poly-beta-1,6-N-acetyl-D-glucosamine synthase